MKINSYKEKGFTLLEFVIVVVIIAILAAVGSRELSSGLNSYNMGQGMATLDWQGGIALERMFREIRSIESSTNIVAATASQLSFVDGAGTSIIYQITSGNLLEGTNILAPYATGLVFTYYNSSGAVTTTISAIQFVQIALTLANSTNNYTYTYTTTVWLPNLA